MDSPNYVKLSTASDIVLGFTSGSFYRGAKPYCINILLHYSDGCKANCLYCGQAREVAKDASCKTLIRVEWPIRRLDEAIGRMKKLMNGGCFMRPYRVCVSSITNCKAVEGEVKVVERIYKSLRLPISILISPTIFTKRRMEVLKEVGAERIGIAIDCATSELFNLLRGSGARGPHRWEVYLKGVEDAVEVVGEGKVGAHLIVGLGETEEEAIEFIQLVRDMGGETHLFSFYPEGGSVLEDWRRPSIGQYRRVQLARYLIDMGYASFKDFDFNEYGQVVGFKVSTSILRDVINSGEPFMTSGCPGCNRPYSNEKPGELFKNFPFRPSPLEIVVIRRQLNSYLKPTNDLENLMKYLERRVKVSLPNA